VPLRLATLPPDIPYDPFLRLRSASFCDGSHSRKARYSAQSSEVKVADEKADRCSARLRLLPTERRVASRRVGSATIPQTYNEGAGFKAGSYSFQIGLADGSQAFSSSHQPTGNSHGDLHRGTSGFTSLFLKMLSVCSASPGSVFVPIAFDACSYTLLQSERSEKVHLDAVQRHKS
jgi:hypothetical protein